MQTGGLPLKYINRAEAEWEILFYSFDTWLLPQMQNQSPKALASVPRTRIPPDRTHISLPEVAMQCISPVREKNKPLQSSGFFHFFAECWEPAGPCRQNTDVMKCAVEKNPGECNQRDCRSCWVGKLKIRQKLPTTGSPHLSHWVASFLNPEWWQAAFAAGLKYWPDKTESNFFLPCSTTVVSDYTTASILEVDLMELRAQRIRGIKRVFMWILSDY